ncbi:MULTISPECIES: TetR/AcrR family transcriptional regulator [unclassified Mucilaginibacter]|uniref:TetR/AcrR family transcriptional regulator n=1 Tax=unclassified Mucilaginibacter TaxID=2617802 RepID=UPI00095EB7DE|nr:MULTISPECIES: TetR/AcrR family transcriptional regulator [unclassified Mucilaginibacter]OJW12590.1 MAG: TetR family transcriptional regulator [Mucilaginibacter sp. 44-25]PLW89953.1 MAG: TetR/AcrR family transcriptional regulator [Mucilaginibacter sp.]HEK21568.1 TetR/AcrR family transcriptional regulator [Bacteroidota bacterium]
MRTRDNNKVELVKKTAIEMMVKDGLEGFSMNKLARACNISVATLYIYYKDRDDLIINIAAEEGQKMSAAITRGFNPEMSFEEGLKNQWRNRYEYMKNNVLANAFFELLRNSSYQERFLESFLNDMKTMLGSFMTNAINRGEIDDLPLEAYWSVAFAPLYALVRFDHEGQSLGGKPFKMTDEIFWKTFELVLKALKK